MILATEDALSEAVGDRLLQEFCAERKILLRLRKNGSGYLRSRIDMLRELAKRDPIFLITDLDQKPCPNALLTHWIGHNKLPENFLLRVAVREVESWIIADHDGIRCFMNKRGIRLPDTPDVLPDPKQTLLQIAARHAPRDIKDDLLVARNALTSQGIGYNRRLCNFVSEQWSPERACERSESLRRACNSLRALQGN